MIPYTMGEIDRFRVIPNVWEMQRIIDELFQVNSKQ